MKATQAKKLKIKILKVNTKQTKARLPCYKSRNKIVQVKRNSFLKCSTMNPLCTRGKSVENSSSTGNSLRRKQLISQYSSKRRRRKCVNRKETQHSMDPSLESSDDSAEARLTGDKSDKRYREISEQRTIGLPVIVEALSDSLSSLSIPEVLKQSEQMKIENNVFSNDPLRARNMDLKEDDACIVVAASLNPNDCSHDRGTDTGTTSPPKISRKLQKDRKQFQNNTSDVFEGSNLSRSERSSDLCEEYTKDSSIGKRERKHNELGVESISKNCTPPDHYPVRFYCLRNKVVAVLSKKARFCFTGKLVVKTIYGAIESYGNVITTENDPIEIYSPRGYSNVSIETSEKFSQSVESNVWKLLSIEGIDRNQKNKLVAEIEQIQPGMAVVLLSNLENKLTKFLQVFYPFRLFPKIKNKPYYSWTDPRRAETILQSNLYVGDYGCKEIIIDPRVAQETAEKMLNRWRTNEWSCTLIAGGKNVGKSTTSRYLINSLLPVSKMVVLVDVDPGQTECTPPGCVSYSLIEQPLMGPNFTHLKTPAFQVYIGDVNVARCVTRYIEGIKMLFDKLSNCPILSRLPIVVNTMGFSQGIGWDIVLFTIKLIRPSFVVQIMSEKPKNNYIGYLSKQVVNRQKVSWATWSTSVIDCNQPCDHELFVVRSHAERKGVSGYESWNMEPYQQRELVLISYLSEILQSPANSVTRYDALSLSINEAVPYALVSESSFSSLYISVPRASVPESHVLNVLNGNIVALCGFDVNNESREIEVTSGPRILNRSPLCACYGFGIIRGVDMEREEVFINTPLPISMMQYVNCLVGCIPVPMTLLQLNQQRNVPYIGGNDVLPMSREHRRGYFRMRYQQV